MVVGRGGVKPEHRRRDCVNLNAIPWENPHVLPEKASSAACNAVKSRWRPRVVEEDRSQHIQRGVGNVIG